MNRSWNNEQYNILLSLEAIKKIESVKLNVNMVSEMKYTLFYKNNFDNNNNEAQISEKLRII